MTVNVKSSTAGIHSVCQHCIRFRSVSRGVGWWRLVEWIDAGVLEGIEWKFWSFNEFVENLGGGVGGLKGMLVRWFIDL